MYQNIRFMVDPSMFEEGGAFHGIDKPVFRFNVEEDTESYKDYRRAPRCENDADGNQLENQRGCNSKYNRTMNALAVRDGEKEEVDRTNDGFAKSDKPAGELSGDDKPEGDEKPEDAEKPESDAAEEAAPENRRLQEADAEAPADADAEAPADADAEAPADGDAEAPADGEKPEEEAPKEECEGDDCWKNDKWDLDKEDLQENKPDQVAEFDVFNPDTMEKVPLKNLKKGLFKACMLHKKKEMRPYYLNEEN